MSKQLELFLDIAATISILIKFDSDDTILHNQDNLVAFLNELGFTTPTGKELTKMNMRIIMSRFTESEKRKIRNEYSFMFDSFKIAQQLV